MRGKIGIILVMLLLLVVSVSGCVFTDLFPTDNERIKNETKSYFLGKSAHSYGCSYDQVDMNDRNFTMYFNVTVEKIE